MIIDSADVAAAYTAEFEQMYMEGRFHTEKISNGIEHVRVGSAEIDVWFPPQDDVMREAIEPLIEGAQNRIDIGVFFLTHKWVSEDLIDAHSRGVEIRIITDATAATNGYTKHELLRVAGIPVKVEDWGGKMHMKAAAIDGEVLIVGSMNWTAAGQRTNDPSGTRGLIWSPAPPRGPESAKTTRHVAGQVARNRIRHALEPPPPPSSS